MLAALYPAWLLASLRSIPFSGTAVTAVAIVARPARLVAHASGDERLIEIWLRRLRPGRRLPRSLLFAALCLAARIHARRSSAPRSRWTSPSWPAALATTAIPPPDPWFAGQPINYYYLGYLLLGTVSRLSGVAPEIGLQPGAGDHLQHDRRGRVRCRLERRWPLPRGDRLAAAGGLFAVFRGRHLGQSLRSLAVDPAIRRRPSRRLVVGQCRSASAGAPAASSVTACASTIAARCRPPRRSTSSRSSASCSATSTLT